MTAASRLDRLPSADAALDDRVRYLIALRFLIAAITIVFAFASPATLALSSQTLVAAACAYVMVALGAIVLGRRGDRVGAAATIGMLLLDGAFLAVAVYGTGGSTSPLRFLLYLQLLAVSLLASPKAGLAIAAWDTLLFTAAFGAQAAGLIAPVDARPGEAIDLRVLPVLNAVAFWVFAVSLAAFSALNERELRQRRADIEAVVRIGIQLEDEGDPVRQAEIVLEGLVGRYGLARGLVVGADDDGLVVLAAHGLTVEARSEVEIDALVRRAWAAGRPVTQSRLDRANDPGLAGLLKGARRLIVAPMLADGRPVGAIVLERRFGQRPGLEQRTARVASQVAAMIAAQPAQRRAPAPRAGPGRARPAHGRGQPADVPARASSGRCEAPRRAATRTDHRSCSSTSTTSRSSTTRSGHAAGDALLVAVTERIESARSATATWSPGSVATSSRSSPTTSPTCAGRGRWPSGSCSELRAPYVIGERRSSSPPASASPAPAMPSARADLVAQRGRRDVHGQGQRQGRLRGLRSRACTPRSASATSSASSSSRPSTSTSSSSATSRSSTSRPARWPASRRWSAGSTPSAAWSRPGEFIEIAEENGSILPIGRWVLREACRQAAAWRPRAWRPGMFVAVNVSAREVQQPGFVDGVREALRDHGIGAGTLVIEITEAALLRATRRRSARSRPARPRRAGRDRRLRHGLLPAEPPPPVPGRRR